MSARNQARLGRRFDSEAGYTLTEMLVVIGIICLIAAVLTPGVLSQLERSRAKAAQLQLDTLASAVEMYRSDVGRYPTAQEGLKALSTEPADVQGWTGPYIRDTRVLTDPWGAPVVYAPVGRRFEVVSLGADQAQGGSGVDRDIRSPTRP